jgi:regulator of replication initiation timing
VGAPEEQVTPPESAITAELSNLRSDVGGVAQGVSEIKTAVAVLVERTDRTTADVKELRAENAALRTELDAVKARLWPLPSAAVVTGLGALVLTLYQMVTR